MGSGSEEESNGREESPKKNWFSNLPFATRLEGYAKGSGKKRREKIKENRKKAKDKKKGVSPKTEGS
eukprot:scaffold23803_cov132-Cylindrotheca_fusiformis.AAC.12